MDTTPELKGSTALVSSSNPVHWLNTTPLALPAPDTLATGTPVGQPFFALALGLKHKKQDSSPCSTPEGHGGKRAHTGTKEGSISSGHSTLPIPLVASHSPKNLEPGFIHLLSSPVKAVATPSDGLAAEVSGEVSGGDADQSSDELDSSSDSQEGAADSGPKSAIRNCLMCSDTEEAAVNTTHKKFKKKVQASCSIAKSCLWSEAQLKQIGDSHQAVWGSDHEIIQTEWELALEEDCTSFEVNKMMVRTDQLLWIKEATHSKILPQESEAEVHGWKKPSCNC